MDDEDALRLIEYLQARFRDLGEPQLADQDAYVKEDPKLGRRRVRPRERLAQMLEAFERTMALDDENTRRKATDLIARAADGRVPEVRVVPYGEDGEPGEPFHFAGLPDLSGERQQLRVLAERIRYDAGDISGGWE